MTDRLLRGEVKMERRLEIREVRALKGRLGPAGASLKDAPRSAAEPAL